MSVSRFLKRRHSFLLVLFLFNSLWGIAQSGETLEECVFDEGVAWIYGHREGPSLCLELEESRVMLNGWPIYPAVSLPQPLPDGFMKKFGPERHEQSELMMAVVDDYKNMRLDQEVDFEEAIERTLASLMTSALSDSVVILNKTNTYVFVEIFWRDNGLPSKIKFTRDVTRKHIMSREKDQQKVRRQYEAYRSILQGKGLLWFSYVAGSSHIIAEKHRTSIDSLLALTSEEVELLKVETFYNAVEFVRLVRNPLSLEYKNGGAQ